MGKEHVVRVTDAQHSYEAESQGRIRRYLMLMGIRIVCFAIAVFTTGWIRWSAAIGAIVIPWIAVVIANTVRRKFYEDAGLIADEPHPHSLDAEPNAQDHTPHADPDVVIGEVIHQLPHGEGKRD